jgi:hypothetical protein
MQSNIFPGYVEDGDLHHVGVVVEAGKRLLLDELPLRGPQQRAVHEAAPEVGRLGVFSQDVGECGDEEAGGAARGVADPLVGLRIHERGDEVDDVARGAELAVRAGGGELRKEILIHVPLEIVAVVGGQVQLVNALDDGAERGAVVDLEGSAAEEELAGVGQAREFVQALDGIAGGIEEGVAGEDDEVAPGEARPFTGEDAGIFPVEGRERLVLLGKQAEKEQVGTLLDGIHRVVHPAGPEDIHEPIYLLAEAGREEVGRRGHRLGGDGRRIDRSGAHNSGKISRRGVGGEEGLTDQG